MPGSKPLPIDARDALPSSGRNHAIPVPRRNAVSQPHLAGGFVSAADVSGEITDGVPDVDEARNGSGCLAHDLNRTKGTATTQDKIVHIAR